MVMKNSMQAMESTTHITTVIIALPTIDGQLQATFLPGPGRPQATPITIIAMLDAMLVAMQDEMLVAMRDEMLIVMQDEMLAAMQERGRSGGHGTDYGEAHETSLSVLSPPTRTIELEEQFIKFE
jgi:hypothetical protein